MTLLIYVTGSTVIIGLATTVLILAMTRGDFIWQREEALKAYRKALADLELAEQDRNTTVREMSRLLDSDATVRLPAWHTFLNPDAAAVDAGLNALEDYANGGER
jgi:hypothetical protein